MTSEEREEIKAEIVAELKGADDEARRESMAYLKRDLLEEIEKDALKKEILNELQPKQSSFGKYLEHPAALLIFGFFLTTIFGTIITSCWKYEEWRNEQEYLKTQSLCERERQTKTEEIKQKYEVKDDIIKGVAETNTAAEEVLKYLVLEPNRRQQEAADRTKYWKEASRNWRINSKILNQRLLFRFTDPRITDLFKEITKYRSLVGNSIDNQQEALSSGNEICSPVVYKANECMSHITINLMPQAVKIMTEEIRADEENLRKVQCLTQPSPQPSAVTTPTPAPSSDKPKTEPTQVNACEELIKLKCEKKQPDQN